MMKLRKTWFENLKSQDLDKNYSSITFLVALESVLDRKIGGKERLESWFIGSRWCVESGALTEEEAEPPLFVT